VHGALKCLIGQVVAPDLAGARITYSTISREDVLPTPLARRGGVFARKRARQVYVAMTGGQVLSMETRRTRELPFER